MLAGECHVWWASRASAGAHLERLLDQGEIARWSRFHREEDRALYLVAHALARIVLGAYLGVHPGEISFSTVCQHCGRAHGKPRLRGHKKPIELSIAHAGQQVAVALARGAPVGVDVEHIAPQRDNASLIRSILSNSEQQVLAHTPGIDWTLALLRYWTRKEALLKATGHGLAVAPSSLTVTAPHEAPALVCWTAQTQLITSVSLYDLNPGPEHLACLAVLGADLDVIERDASDLLATPFINEASS